MAITPHHGYRRNPKTALVRYVPPSAKWRLATNKKKQVTGSNLTFSGTRIDIPTSVPVHHCDYSRRRIWVGFRPREKFKFQQLRTAKLASGGQGFAAQKFFERVQPLLKHYQKPAGQSILLVMGKTKAGKWLISSVGFPVHNYTDRQLQGRSLHNLCQDMTKAATYIDARLEVPEARNLRIEVAPSAKAAKPKAMVIAPSLVGALGKKRSARSGKSAKASKGVPKKRAKGRTAAAEPKQSLHAQVAARMVKAGLSKRRATMIVEGMPVTHARAILGMTPARIRSFFGR